MNTGPELIMLIDDDEDDNFFHKRAIRKSGLSCKIDVCTSGDVAIDYLSNQGQYSAAGENYPQPDLIFLDINMPRVDGWEFLERYAHWIDEDENRTLPTIIILSNSNNASDIKRAEANNFVREYVVKPLRKEAVLQIVNNHLREASAT